jgi:diaminohydroxyphosphoribosylaminopyrimidine deaminase/5-amino-6-(5-phosphoribosylamino)uracil reductase
MNPPETYMRRCLELALLGAGHTAPNPMVGAVLVHEGRIIGEGYHRQYGQAHAEVNCIAAVKEGDLPLIAQSTLFVSLEPCAHHGKTPPCADLVVEKKIPRVVIGCRDPFPLVNGKGIEKLLAAGVDVSLGVLEKECVHLNRRFFTFNTLHRPFILLKWAQSANGMIAGPAGGEEAGQAPKAEGRHWSGGSGVRTLISNEYSNRLVHKWRSEEAAILVGARTALLDDPALTVRSWKGPNPVRLVIDKELRLPSTLQLFDRRVPTIVFNLLRHKEEGETGESGEGEGEGDNLSYYQLATDSSLVHQVVMALYRLKISSVMVEGGARLLQSFIDEGYWDEARVITNDELEISGGLASPELKDPQLLSREIIFSDTIRYYKNPASVI